MDSLGLLVDGFAAALTPMNLVWVFIGAVLGTAVGVLPGLGSSMAVALLLPVTFTLDPTGAFIMFAGVYFGGLFGDSISGILLNTPGNSSAIASTIEGHKMALSGRAAQALATSAIGAFIGGLLATTLVVFAAPVMAKMATLFGPAEYFALAVFAFVAISAVVADSILKGAASLLIGLSIAFVGIDAQSGASRFTLGIPQFFDGVSIIVVTVGMLALGEVFYLAARNKHPREVLIMTKQRPFLSKSEFLNALPAWLRGTAFGLPFGVIPVGGSEIPTFLAYGTERNLDKKRRKPQFGNGAIRGVAAPEAAGNATAGTAMGALLTLGLPTSATAAIMLAAFTQYGMQPGPLLFEKNGDLVWTLLASLFIGLFVLLVLNLPFAPLWAKLLKLPRHYLYAGIAVCAGFGVYASGSSAADLFLLLIIGVVAFLMRRANLPIAPVLIAVVLGPMAETELRRTLAIGQGDIGALFSSSITIVLYSLLTIVVIGAALVHLRRRQVEKISAETGN